MSKSKKRRKPSNNIELGYSASVCSSGKENGFNWTSNKMNSIKTLENSSHCIMPSQASISSSNCNSIFRHNSLSSNLSSFSSKRAMTKQEIAVAKWSIQPVLGSQAIRVCGSKVIDGKSRGSGAITMRVHSRCVLSANGTLYKLIGPIHHSENVPNWLEEQFRNGFPPSWKVFVNKYLDWLSQKDSDEESEDDNVTSISAANPPPRQPVDVKLELCQWAVHLNGKHVVIEGFSLDEEGKPQLYRTGAVTRVDDKTMIYTANGSVYRLRGPICLEATVQASIPLYFAKQFNDGFPINWKELVASYHEQLHSRNGSFHSHAASEKSDVPSMTSCKGQNGVRLQIPGLRWPSFISEGENRSLMDTSNVSTNVNVPDTVVRRAHVAKVAQQCTEEMINFDVDEDLSIDNVNETPQNKPQPHIHSHIKTGSKRSMKRQSYKIKSNRNTKSVQKKAHLSAKKGSPADKPLNVPNFCTPSPGNGLYRTRSGRHVLPPLQNWTYQRLNREFDEDGNEVIVLYPGNKSVLKGHSPAAEALRTSDWIHRQFQQDQLGMSPQNLSVPAKKKKASNSSKKNCVKNIMTDTADKPPCGGKPDDSSSTLVEESLMPDVLQSSPVNEPASNSSIVQQSPHSRATDAERKVKQKETETASPTTTHARTPDSCEKLKEQPRYNLRRSHSDKESISPTDKTKTKQIERSSRQKKNSPSNTYNLRCCHKDTSKSGTSHTSPSKKTNVLKCNGKKTTKQATKKQSLSDDPTSGKQTKRSANKVTKEVKQIKRKHSKTPEPKRHSKRKKYAKTEELKPNNSHKEEQPLSHTTTITRNQESGDCVLADMQTLPLKKSSMAQKQKKSSAAKEVKTSKRSRSTKPKNTENKENKCETTKSRTKQQKMKNEPQGKGAAISARRGTLKRRQQVKDALTTINTQNEDQDFFGSSTQANSLFDKQFFQMNSRDYITPFTPVAKLPDGFDQYVATPAWFKTPKASESWNFADAQTPSHLQTGLPNPQVQGNAADRIVIQMQNDKKKRKQKLRKTSTKERKKPRKKNAVLPSDLFHIEANVQENSTDDEYFSE